MKRPRYLQRTHEMLESWASWQILHPHGISLLGRMTIDLTKVRSGLPPASLTPTDLPPRPIAKVDQALSDPEIPRKHLEVVALYYLGEREQARAVPRRAVDCMLEYMAGRLR